MSVRCYKCGKRVHPSEKRRFFTSCSATAYICAECAEEEGLCGDDECASALPKKTRRVSLILASLAPCRVCGKDPVIGRLTVDARKPVYVIECGDLACRNKGTRGYRDLWDAGVEWNRNNKKKGSVNG